MTSLDRRAALLAALLAPITATTLSSCSAQAAQAAQGAAEGDPQAEPKPAPPGWFGKGHIAMLVYPRMTALDLIGPQYMFASLTGAKVHLVAKTLDPVTSDTGVTITPTTTFKDTPEDLMVLFTPGGTTGTLAAARDEETRAFMADRGARAQYVTSVCTGSLILGAAGLLKGYRATSHWAARDILAEYGATPVDARVVKDRNRITGAGVTAGLDFGLAMLAELRDDTYAQAVQLMCEYDPDPPFHAGSIHTAPSDVKATVQGIVAPFQEQARALARDLRRRT